MSAVDVTYKRRLCIWPTRCSATGDTIPMFNMAYKRWTEYDQMGWVTFEFDWVSEAGYIIESLKGNG